MSDKSAFPHSLPEHQRGMAFREWQWTQFAKNPPTVEFKGCTREQYLGLSVQWACDYADAMMVAIAEREKERDDV